MYDSNSMSIFGDDLRPRRLRVRGDGGGNSGTGLHSVRWQYARRQHIDKY